MESATCLTLWLCAGQSHGTFPPRAAQPSTCRAQHSGYLTCASRTGWLACAVGDVHSPLRRGSPVCCVMRKAWGPVCVSDPASCLWGDLPAHPKNSAWDRGQLLQSQDKNNQIQHCFSKTRSWFLNNCSFLIFPVVLNAFLTLMKCTLWFLEIILHESVSTTHQTQNDWTSVWQQTVFYFPLCFWQLKLK